jgi:hypothetical protein
LAVVLRSNKAFSCGWIRRFGELGKRRKSISCSLNCSSQRAVWMLSSMQVETTDLVRDEDIYAAYVTTD